MNTRIKRILFPIIILAVAGALFMLLANSKKPPEKKAEKAGVPFVATETIYLKPLSLTVRSQGLVKPKFNTSLLAQVSGEIVLVSEKFVKGGLVKKGELLAQIDPFNYEVNLQQANATLASAKAQFVLERAQGRVAEAEWKNITNAQPSELGLRKPQQEQALAAVKAAEAGVKQAEKDLARTKILAPFDALVTARDVSPGSFANMGTVIGNVVNVEIAEVRLPVPGNDLAYLVNNGINSPVTLRAAVGEKMHYWQATITRDEGLIDDNSRMVYLVATVSDPYQFENNQRVNTERLPFGTYVTAEIEGLQLNAAAVVPRHLIKDNKLALAVENKLYFTEIEVLRHEGENSVITVGLNNGDQLITSALSYPVAGMALKVDEIQEQKNSDKAITTAEPNALTSSKKEG